MKSIEVDYAPSSPIGDDEAKRADGGVPNN